MRRMRILVLGDGSRSGVSHLQFKAQFVAADRHCFSPLLKFRFEWNFQQFKSQAGPGSIYFVRNSVGITRGNRSQARAASCHPVSAFPISAPPFASPKNSALRRFRQDFGRQVPPACETFKLRHLPLDNGCEES